MIPKRKRGFSGDDFRKKVSHADSEGGRTTRFSDHGWVVIDDRAIGEFDGGGFAHIAGHAEHIGFGDFVSAFVIDVTDLFHLRAQGGFVAGWHGGVDGEIFTGSECAGSDDCH